MYKKMAEILEPIEKGNFKLSKFEITKENRPWRTFIPDGEYMRLTSSWDCIMSDTPMEQRTNIEFVEKAHGNVLIAGLGIGMIVLPVMEKESVTSITIIEKEQDIIDMILPQLPVNSKVKVIHQDVFENKFPKGTKFDVIYFDIWSGINSEIYNNEMKYLKKIYKRCLVDKKINPNRWIKCWAEYQAKNNMRLI